LVQEQWSSDFTHVATWKGFVRVAFVIDAYARKIVGWRVSTSAHAGFLLDAREQAIHPPAGKGRRPRSSQRPRVPIPVHSLHRAPGGSRDRALGRQRRCAASATVMTTRWPRRSTASSRPRSFTRRGPWRSLEAVGFATLERVDWFDTRRLLDPIGNIPPAEAEEHCYAEPETRAVAA